MTDTNIETKTMTELDTLTCIWKGADSDTKNGIEHGTDTWQSFLVTGLETYLLFVTSFILRHEPRLAQ